MSSKLQPENITSEMPVELRDDVTGLIRRALEERENRRLPQNLAAAIKTLCDENLTGTWHCHVGPSFGSSFPCEDQIYLHCQWRDLTILVYKFL